MEAKKYTLHGAPSESAVLNYLTGKVSGSAFMYIYREYIIGSLTRPCNFYMHGGGQRQANNSFEIK